MSKKKVSLPGTIIVITFGIILEYFAYLLAGTVSMQKKFNPVMVPDLIIKELENPFVDYRNEYTVPVMGSIAFIYVLYLLYRIANRHNLMPGREYGNAEWADPRRVSRKLADPSRNLKDEKNIVVRTHILK